MGFGPWKQFVPMGVVPLKKCWGYSLAWFDLRVKVLGNNFLSRLVRYINVIQTKKDYKGIV